jgi:5'-3' exonuclease
MNELQTEVVSKELHRLDLNSTYLTSEERNMAKQLFYACGIVSLNASCEADSVLAHFAKRNEIVAVISHDFDLLARGVETLLVPESYALPGDESGWTMYNLTAICKKSELSYDQLVDMCVLMGCDYTHGGVRVPYKTAYWLIKHHGTLHRVLSERGVTDTHMYEDAVRILKGHEDTPEMLMNERQWQKWVSPPCDVELDILYSLRPTILKSLSHSDFQLLHYGAFTGKMEDPVPVPPPIPAVRNTIQNVPTDSRNRIRNKIADRRI